MASGEVDQASDKKASDGEVDRGIHYAVQSEIRHGQAWVTARCGKVFILGNERAWPGNLTMVNDEAVTCAGCEPLHVHRPPAPGWEAIAHHLAEGAQVHAADGCSYCAIALDRYEQHKRKGLHD